MMLEIMVRDEGIRRSEMEEKCDRVIEWKKLRGVSWADGDEEEDAMQRG